MNCENVQPRLTALLDGELAPDEATAVEQHLVDCSACTQVHTEFASVREIASAWQADVPDVSARVLAVVAADNQYLLDEIRLLRTEMAELHAEVSALRRQFSHRTEMPQWTSSARFDTQKDYPLTEKDPWNLIRS